VSKLKYWRIPMADNQAVTPNRILKEQAFADDLNATIPPAECMKNAKYMASSQYLEELENVVGKAKSFLFGFLAKLHLIEWLQWMNHACLNPLKEKDTARKHKSNMGIPTNRYLEEEQAMHATKPSQGKKGRPGRVKAAKPR